MILIRYRDGCRSLRTRRFTAHVGSIRSDPHLIAGRGYLRPHVRQLFRRPRGDGWGPELGVGDHCYYLKLVRR